MHDITGIVAKNVDGSVPNFEDYESEDTSIMDSNYNRYICKHNPIIIYC